MKNVPEPSLKLKIIKGVIDVYTKALELNPDDTEVSEKLMEVRAILG